MHKFDIKTTYRKVNLNDIKDNQHQISRNNFELQTIVTDAPIVPPSTPTQSVSPSIPQMPVPSAPNPVYVNGRDVETVEPWSKEYNPNDDAEVFHPRRKPVLLRPAQLKKHVKYSGMKPSEMDRIMAAMNNDYDRRQQEEKDYFTWLDRLQLYLMYSNGKCKDLVVFIVYVVGVLLLLSLGGVAGYGAYKYFSGGDLSIDAKHVLNNVKDVLKDQELHTKVDGLSRQVAIYSMKLDGVIQAQTLEIAKLTQSIKESQNLTVIAISSEAKKLQTIFHQYEEKLEHNTDLLQQITSTMEQIRTKLTDEQSIVEQYSYDMTNKVAKPLEQIAILRSLLTNLGDEGRKHSEELDYVTRDLDGLRNTLSQIQETVDAAVSIDELTGGLSKMENSSNSRHADLLVQLKRLFSNIESAVNKTEQAIDQSVTHLEAVPDLSERMKRNVRSVGKQITAQYDNVKSDLDDIKRSYIWC